ncbi:hypothetical protein [Deinococcus planocerae]|uniref:hypothetical protein n=1 Tax=Deinococcus planocerae TaxID=1737569 RepID=UPI0015E14F4C|nr:hypothetical protein [Deinococcus planocerae]
MKSDTGRKAGLVFIAILTSALTLAQAAGAKDFGQRSVQEQTGVSGAQGGAKDFGQ